MIVVLLVSVQGIALPALHDHLQIAAFGRKEGTTTALTSDSEIRCLRLQRQFGAAIDQSWQSLSVGVRAEWLSRRCNLVLLRALRSPKYMAPGYAHANDFSATAARTSYASAVAWGNAEPATSRDGFNTAPKRSALAQCEKMRRAYGVRPGVSWGTLPQAQRHTWTSLDCDQFFMDIFGVDKSST